MFQINILENATGHAFDSYFNGQHILRQLTDLNFKWTELIEKMLSLLGPLF